jgi:DHA1 family tetracycline resistance protein-like MFS transporter
VISGITSASISTAFAYIADVVPAEKRAEAYGKLGAAFGLGFVIGPGIGGLLGHYDLRLPFWVAAGLSLVNGCYGLFVLPESLPKESRKAFSLKQANPIGALVLLQRKPQLMGMGIVTFCTQLAHHVLPSCFVLYAGYRYHWGMLEVGGTLTLVGVLNSIVQATMIRPALKRFGDIRAIIIGLSAAALGFAVYGAADTGPIFLIGVPTMALWGLAAPPGQAIMSKQLGPTEQGALQGAIGSIQGIAGVMGPKLFTKWFVWGMDTGLPGAPFFVSASLVTVAMLVVATVVRRQKFAEPAPAPAPAPTEG